MKILLKIVTGLLLWIGSVIPSSAQDSNVRAGTEGTGKPYTITVRLRQEYDDNINTTSTNKDASLKTIVNPGIVFTFPMEQTLISFSYNFGLTYYWDRPDDDFDMSHLFAARVNHKFSDRFSLDLREQFRFAQEAQVTNGSAIQRFLGDGFKNSVSLDGTAQWTERFSTITGYSNDIQRYDSTTVGLVNDYIIHAARQDFQLQVLPSTTAVMAYSYRTIDYTDGSVFGTRDYDTHQVTVGADHYLLENWLLSGRAGGQFVFYENQGLSDGVNPYVDLSTAWTYLPGSRIKASYNYGTNLTDDAASGSSEGHTLTFDITHAITPKLSVGGNITALFQTLDRNTALGAANNQGVDEDTLNAGVNITYTINDYLSADAGYTYSYVTTNDSLREYYRNQFYIGITGKY